MSTPDYLTLAVAVVVPATLLASWIDFRSRKVPNWLNAALAAGGLAAQAVYFGWSGVGQGAAGIGVGLACLILPWAMGGMGAGDVKLLAAIGAWLGPAMCLAAFAVGALAGGVIALVMIAAQRKFAQAANNLGLILAKVSRWETAFGDFASARTLGSTSALLPYGIPLTAGTWIVLFARWAGR